MKGGLLQQLCQLRQDFWWPRLWRVLQRRDLSGALTADRLHAQHRNATPRERESDPAQHAQWRPPPESSFTVNFPSALSDAAPENRRPTECSRAERSWWFSLSDMYHSCPSHSALPRPAQPHSQALDLSSGEHSPLPTALLYCLCRRPEGGKRVRGAAQATREMLARHLATAIS